MVLTFESVDAIFKCDHSNEHYSAGTQQAFQLMQKADYPVHRISHKVVLTFESVAEIYSNESY